jgi:predicted kinase
MPRVVICKGLPASGKSTWAREYVREHPSTTKRINKDDLRAMLDDSHHTKTNEKFVEQARDLLILSALDAGKHVIVDDTNLAPRHGRHIKTLVKGRATVEVKWFHIDVEEAIRRDLNRPRSVGEAVIRGMWRDHIAPRLVQYETDPALPTAVIVDLDGTLALMVARGPYDTGKCESDELNPVVHSIIVHHQHVLLMSGRDEKFRPETERWLAANNVNYDALHMRAQGDVRKDSIVKQELFEAHVRGKWNVSFVLDDRQQVVDMWRDLGLTCLQVAPGDF